MSVTFCVGNISVKRRAFHTAEAGCVTVDNDDVLLCFSLSGKLYCAQGAIPYANLTVREYVAYNCSLRYDHPLSDKEIRYLLRVCDCRLPLHKRVGRLSRVQFRHLQLVVRVELDSKKLRLNFDGLDYSRRHRRQLTDMLQSLSKRFDVAVAVTDLRFIPRLAHVVRYEKEGVAPYIGGVKSSYPAPRRLLLKEMAKRHLPLNRHNVKRILYVNPL